MLQQRRGRRAFFRLSAGLAVTSVIRLPRRAEAQACRGSIPNVWGTANMTFPYGYYIDRKIDGEGGDFEYVFQFALKHAPEHHQLKWETSSSRINDVSARWNHHLYSPQSCASPVLVYADAGAVQWSGGPEHWKEHLWLWY